MGGVQAAKKAGGVCFMLRPLLLVLPCIHQCSVQYGAWSTYGAEKYGVLNRMVVAQRKYGGKARMTAAAALWASCETEQRGLARRTTAA
jgi:hypothetical protein